MREVNNACVSVFIDVDLSRIQKIEILACAIKEHTKELVETITFLETCKNQLAIFCTRNSKYLDYFRLDFTIMWETTGKLLEDVSSSSLHKEIENDLSDVLLSCSNKLSKLMDIDPAGPVLRTLNDVFNPANAVENEVNEYEVQLEREKPGNHD